MARDVPEAHEKTVASQGGTAQRSTGQVTSLQPGEILGERYRVVELLGAGAQGEVWRAEDVEIEGHVVALKILAYRATTPEQRDQALRELKMLAAINHPSVVQFKDNGWLGGRLWFAMPWYEGRDLESAMPLDRAEARRVFETLAGGLAAVHAKGLRHQDIKPSNIFLAKVSGVEQTMPVLLDFGVAAKEGEQLVAGSPDYFAPELAEGWPTAARLGPEADVFSLALALRNVLEPGTAPTVGAFDKASLAERAKTPIEPPQARELRYLAPHFRRWLAIDPAARPTARELVDELAVLTAPEDRARDRIKLLRRVGPWAALLLLVVAIGGWRAWNAVVDARKAAAAEAAAREAEEARADEAASTAADALARAAASSARTEDALRRLDDAETQIGRAEGDAQAMRAARDALRAALRDARTELAGSQAALADTEARVATLSQQLGATQHDLGVARAELDQTRSTLAATTSERDGARADLATRTTERDTARADLATRTTERDTARADLATRTTERDTARAELETANASLGTRTTERDEARAARASAESALATATAAQADLESRIHQLEARVRELEGRRVDPTPSTPELPGGVVVAPVPSDPPAP
ncbi:MAG: protein kinase [Sandaracinus sp.]